MRIALVGSGRLARSLLLPLLESHHEVVALVQDGRRARRIQWGQRSLGALLASIARRISSSFTYLITVLASPFGYGDIIGIALRKRIPIIWIDRMTEDELEPLRRLEPDLLLVGSFAIILKKPLLDLPKLGCVNTHPSLLPKHRGPNPFSAVIMAREHQTGVTFHIMDEGIDSGDVLEQYSFPIEPTDTAFGIYGKACEVARRHIVSLMDRIETGGLHGTPQDHSQATYDRRLERGDTRIDWTKSVHDIYRLIRAAKPIFLPSFTFRGKTVYVSVVKAHAKPCDAEPGTVVSCKPLRIATGDGVLTILVAYTRAPFPWVWPMPWNRPRIGEKVG